MSDGFNDKKCPRNCNYIYSALVDGILDKFIYENTEIKDIKELEKIIIEVLKKNQITVSQLVVRNNALNALRWVNAYFHDINTDSLLPVERKI